ncbi:hypothetical protein I302_109029 [Kwoniella bestiolae CBS 10118]|uniref:DUF3074 domain-containing protein n=1 Tax=Kwoniella bestiolae CBS 10118 TaxID=1296100 RepID=A0A1B9FUT2_9TREE|nr:hypothetical protein I302_08172 [Kwoniella bestiolae CBS 10118]OCF22522.1 hypothetical protein I302_08172 [Kwoniella bestiolae CBS 10118]
MAPTIKPVHLDLQPLKPEDIPDPSSAEFDKFLNDHFEMGIKLTKSMSDWNHHSTKHDGTVRILNLTTSSTYNDIRKSLNGIKEYWCGRESHHSTSLPKLPTDSSTPSKRHSASYNPVHLARRLSDKITTRHSEDKGHANGNALNGSAIEEEEPSEVERQALFMSTTPEGIYERFRRGLLEYHSENEREYIESMRESECLQVYRKHCAEVWRLTFKTPPPTNPRTFVVLLLSRELTGEPKGERAFMNISIPFEHPDCPPKVNNEKSRVRGKYVSVERVREIEGGREVEWRMATSSDAGGNIPRFVTNGSLPNSIAEDVPSFLGWMVKRFPVGGEVTSRPIA